MQRLALVLLLTLIPVLLNAQSRRWKSLRYEVVFGAGATNFLGELGGADQIGTDFYRDLEFSQTRPATSLGLRYYVGSRAAVKANFTYGILAGDDATTNEFHRQYRNLNFKTNIYELTTVFEYMFLSERPGARYKLKGVKGIRGYNIAFYGFAGVGVLKFNPQGEYNGKWYDLQPLGTEGQGIIESRKKYDLVQLVIPGGIGFKYAIDRRWSVGIEYGVRKTFTDYIDDVSRSYVEKSILDQIDPLSYYLADKSNGDFPSNTSPGAQRGDPNDKDSYLFALFTINYKLRSGGSHLPVF
ncbi:MAG: hypothetical protein HKO56_03180 [Bacteroidia bacterium]|nr:hypothetical protein [Bacteroidia bacterium]NNC86732.1 hypothetical protein [Bacteroidia bacterium]NNM15638.1 hypothetical protein [Bacteroidia bacterium]